MCASVVPRLVGGAHNREPDGPDILLAWLLAHIATNRFRPGRGVRAQDTSRMRLSGLGEGPTERPLSLLLVVIPAITIETNTATLEVEPLIEPQLDEFCVV